MQRVILYIITISIIAITAPLLYLYNINPIRENPLPFRFEKGIYNSEEVATNADILIIGDDFGVQFNRQVGQLLDELSSNLEKPLSIYNIAAADENIYRTLEKVKSLKKLPPIIIYMGGNREFHEDLFPENLERFEFNFNLYRNDYIQSAILLFPKLSKILFVPSNQKVIGKEIRPIQFYGDSWFFKVLEATLYFYRQKLSEMADYLLEKNVHLITVVPPINYESGDDLEPCLSSVTNEISIEQNDIKQLVTKTNFKEAYNRALMLDSVSVGNALSKYYLGLSQLRLGQLTKARKNLIHAKALNCRPKYAHPSINKIIIEVSKEKSLDLVDFDKRLNSNLGRETLFLDDENVQFIQVEKLNKVLVSRIKEVLKL